MTILTSGAQREALSLTKVKVWRCNAPQNFKRKAAMGWRIRMSETSLCDNYISQYSFKV